MECVLSSEQEKAASLATPQLLGQLLPWGLAAQQVSTPALPGGYLMVLSSHRSADEEGKLPCLFPALAGRMSWSYCKHESHGEMDWAVF